MSAPRRVSAASGVWTAMTMIAASVSAPTLAASWHVRADAAGANDGSDWNNAFIAIPTPPNRGDTYYVAGGSYGDLIINTPGGGGLITIRKATAADHGSNVGWLDAYGTSVAAFRVLALQTSGVVFDGVTGSGSSGHGFELYSATGQLGLIQVRTADITNITIAHTEIHYPTSELVDGGGADVSAEGIYATFRCDACVFAHNHIHDIPGIVLYMRDWVGLTFEHNYVARNRDGVYTAMGVSTGGGGDHVYRYNTWEDIEGLALIRNQVAPASTNWEFYGNVVRRTGNPTYHSLLFGVISDNSGNAADIVGLKFYNNTIVGLAGTRSGLLLSSLGSSGASALNNIWYECQNVSFIGAAHDYNAYGAGTFRSGEYTAAPNDQSLAASPFVSLAGGDHRLAGATAAGQVLASPYNLDMLGTLRAVDGSWDRGAYEHGAPCPAGSACDDGDLCTHTDTCSGGICIGTPYSCDDANLCTADSCNGDGSCSRLNNSLPCDDGNPCSHGDSCSGGACDGTGYSCDDANGCTSDSCNGDGTCVFSPNLAACDDGDACSHSDACDGAGACAGVAYSCSGSVCVSAACDGLGGCDLAPVPAGQSCSDGDPCNGLETCDGAGNCPGTGAALCTGTPSLVVRSFAVEPSNRDGRVTLLHLRLTADGAPVRLRELTVHVETSSGKQPVTALHVLGDADRDGQLGAADVEVAQASVVAGVAVVAPDIIVYPDASDDWLVAAAVTLPAASSGCSAGGIAALTSPWLAAIASFALFGRRRRWRWLSAALLTLAIAACARSGYEDAYWIWIDPPMDVVAASAVDGEAANVTGPTLASARALR